MTGYRDAVSDPQENARTTLSVELSLVSRASEPTKRRSYVAITKQ